MIWSNKSYNEHTKTVGRFVLTLKEIDMLRPDLNWIKTLE